MEKILKFKEFVISEKYQLNQNDDPEITSQKKSFNEIESYITEYQNKKVTIDNIYKTYIDNKDLLNKLKSQKLLEGDVSNVNTIKFTNPLLAIHAQISRKMREISDIQKFIKSDQDTIDNKKSVIATSGDNIKSSLKEDIKEVESKINSEKDRIRKLDNEIINLKKQIDEQVNKMKKQLIDSQRRINLEQSS